MKRVVLDPATLAQLHGVHYTVELCDGSGREVGQFVPVVNRSEHTDLEPQVSEEELDRRERSSGGVPLQIF